MSKLTWWIAILVGILCFIVFAISNIVMTDTIDAHLINSSSNQVLPLAIAAMAVFFGALPGIVGFSLARTKKLLVVSLIYAIPFVGLFLAYYLTSIINFLL